MTFSYKKPIILLIALLLWSPLVSAEQYKVNVTRKATHLYRIDGTSYYLRMPYCYEYSYSEEVILDLQLSYGRVMGTAYFPESDYGTGRERFTKAETVTGLLIATPLAPGYCFLSDSNELLESGTILIPATALP